MNREALNVCWTLEKILKNKLKAGRFVNVPLKRSKTMAAIKGHGNITTERRLRLALVRKGIKGWKLHPRGVAGNPDFFFPAYQIAVFVDGCFWHGCPKCGHIPKTNRAFWKEKISRTKQRDRETNTRLESEGTHVVRFWEHEVRDDINGVLFELKNLLASMKTKKKG